MTNFNWIDVLLILLVLLSIWGGWRRGFILSFLDLVRWIGSLLAGLFFYSTVARWLDLITDWTEVWNQPIAFILVVVVTGVLIQIAGNWFLRRIPKDVHRRRVNRIFGILPGLANGLLTAAIVSALLFSVPFSEGLSESVRESSLANRFAVFTDELETALVPIFDPAIRQTLNRRTIEPESTERVSLPFKVENTRPRPELEAMMLDLINRERAANGLAPLEADPEMLEVARKHSADMFTRGYFSHYTPENESPFDRMRAGDVRFRTAGENLAFAPSVQIAHTGLMNSPGHRANILNPPFGRVGIGILDGGRRGLMITQNFRN
ncbi:MAG: CvpA family protein [Pyrinomonadaceae bacterium]